VFSKAARFGLLLLLLLLTSPLAAAPREGEEVGWWTLPLEIVAGDDDVCGIAWHQSVSSSRLNNDASRPMSIHTFPQEDQCHAWAAAILLLECASADISLLFRE
jgi:hypothetical protein